ncbi:WD40-repeat-containing domain protein [Boletus coccyginus]|nr:WD40-repeat-containing domain protein [Boletus coccyginus]
MDAGSIVFNIAVSRDGQLIVSGTESGWVTVWNAKTRSKVTEFKAHERSVRMVNISPDATKIVTGSDDSTVCVWSLLIDEKLLGPLKHNGCVVATKFSPDGHLIATATWVRRSVRVYDSWNGSLLVEFLVEVKSPFNQSLTWASDKKELFALSHDGYIYHVDVSTKSMLSKWLIHSSDDPECIALASNGTFVAASGDSSVSLWDATTHEQIGAVIGYTHRIQSMAISSSYHLVTREDNKITLRTLCGFVPSHYTSRIQGIQHAATEKVDDSPNESTADLKQTIQELRTQLAKSQQTCQERDALIQSLRAQEESSNSKIARLEKANQEQAESQRAADQENNDLNETINSLRADLCTRDDSSSVLRIQLADAQRKADGINHALEQMYQCESRYAQGHIQGAVECLLEFANIVHEDVRANKFIIDWVAEFTQQCITALESIGDEASNTDKWNEAVAAYSTALSLGPTIPNTIMSKWANTTLKRGSAREASSAANKFKVPRFIVYRVICDILERDGRLVEAVECFQQMQSELPEDAGVRDEREKWELDFKARCMKVLEQNGDVAMGTASYEDAVAHYSTALFLDPLSAVLLTKQSKARDGLLQDANAVHCPQVAIPPACLSHHDICLRYLLDPTLPFEDDVERFTPVDEDSGDGDPDTPFTNPRPPSSYTAASSHHTPRPDKLTRALSRASQTAFGAVLLVPLSHDEYKRVAPDHPIVVQLLKGISSRYLAQKIQTLDIL